ncbi:MAG: hypothetical protein ACXQS3_02105 [Candidatus Methanofastidiosia archaeon]
MSEEIIGLSIVLFIISIILSFLVLALFIWFGAKVASIKNASYGKAFSAAIAITIFTAILNMIFVALNIVTNGIIGILIGILVAIWVIKSIFSTNWGKAFIAWIFAVVGAILLGIFLIVVLGASFLF